MRSTSLRITLSSNGCRAAVSPEFVNSDHYTAKSGAFDGRSVREGPPTASSCARIFV